MTPAPRDNHDLVIKKLESIDATLKLAVIQLFGSADPDLEKPSGRLPAVENKANSAHKRLDSLQRRVIYLSGMVAGAAWVLIKVAEVALGTYLHSHH